MKLNRKGWTSLQSVMLVLALALMAFAILTAWSMFEPNAPKKETVGTPAIPDLCKLGDEEMQKWMIGKIPDNLSSAGFYDAQLVIAPNGRVYAVAKDSSWKIRKAIPLAGANQIGQ